MPPELRDPTDPAQWLRRARSNLALARANRALPDVLFEDLAFDAQQAAEKAIKAVLVHRKLEFPKTHAIAELLDHLERDGLPIPPPIREASRLTRYAVLTRYVGLAEDVSESDYRRAISLADDVLRWAEEHTKGPGHPSS